MVERLLESLLEEGIITEKDINQIKRSGKDVGEYLIEKGLLGETSYCEWFCRTFGFRSLDDSIEQDVSLIRIFPKDVLLEYKFFPVNYKSGVLLVASSNPFSLPLKKIQDFCGSVKVEVVIVSPFKVREIVKGVFRDNERGGIDELIEGTVRSAVELGATDIHIFPNFHVKFRVKGILQHFTRLSELSFQLLVNKIKIMAGLDIAEKRLPQDGRFSILNHDIRVSIIPTSSGEKVALRILKRDFDFSLENIGLSDEQVRTVKLSLSKRSGFIFIAGPTGHGKTTTIYSMLKDIDRERLNIISIEDPIEYNLSDVNQVQVNEDIGLTFAKILRHVLRQNPDVIFVGEIRDPETADIAVKAALTGHLVLTTVHAKDVASGIIRLVDLGSPLDMLLSTLTLGISQRLVRIKCDKCGGDRCEDCSYTGIKGLDGVFEVVPFDEEIKIGIKSLAKNGELLESEIRKIFRNFGFSLLLDELNRKLQEGKIRESDLAELV